MQDERTRMLVSNLCLLQWSLWVGPVDHTEGDALGFGGEGPWDGGTGGAHADGDDAVAAGLDEELPGAFSKAGDVVQGEGSGESAAQETSSKTQTLVFLSHFTLKIQPGLKAWLHFEGPWTVSQRDDFSFESQGADLLWKIKTVTIKIFCSQKRIWKLWGSGVYFWFLMHIEPLGHMSLAPAGPWKYYLTLDWSKPGKKKSMPPPI